MKHVFITAMAEAFDLSQMLAKIDYHHVRGNLTDADREELAALAREKANFSGSVDVLKKLEEIENRLRVLEGNTASGGAAETAPEYQAGKWYYTGDRVTVDGKTFVCIVPEGKVCVWSPAEYPDYWECVE